MSLEMRKFVFLINSSIVTTSNQLELLRIVFIHESNRHAHHIFIIIRNVRCLSNFYRIIIIVFRKFLIIIKNTYLIKIFIINLSKIYF